jgi:predicted nucleic acid-binding Zn ribbon protein
MMIWLLCECFHLMCWFDLLFSAPPSEIIKPTKDWISFRLTTLFLINQQRKKDRKIIFFLFWRLIEMMIMQFWFGKSVWGRFFLFSSLLRDYQTGWELLSKNKENCFLIKSNIEKKRKKYFDDWLKWWFTVCEKYFLSITGLILFLC